MGRELPGDSPLLASELVEGHPDVWLPGGDQAGGLHDEHDRVFEHDAAEGVEEPVTVPKRRGGVQAALLGVAQHQQEVDNADQELERCDEPVRHPLRWQSADGRTQLKLTYTDRLELPSQKILIGKNLACYFFYSVILISVVALSYTLVKVVMIKSNFLHGL